MNLKMIRFLWGIVFSFPFEIVAQDSYQRVLRLDELFQLVDSCSKTVKSYEAAVNVADEAIRVSKNALLPEINFSASASYNGNAWVADRDFSNGQFYSSPHFGNSFSLEVSQVIFAGGAIMNKDFTITIGFSSIKFRIRKAESSFSFNGLLFRSV